MDSSVYALLQKQRELVNALGIKLEDPKTLDSAVKGLVCEAAEILDLTNDHSRPWVSFGSNEELRKETTDALFYILEIFMCLGMTAEDIIASYARKHQLNMVRAQTRIDKPTHVDG